MLLSVKELQKQLNVSRDLAYSLMHAKGFPSIKIGCRYFISEEALIKWLSKNEGREIVL